MPRVLDPPRYFTRAGRHSCSCLRSSSCELNFRPHCWHLNSSMNVPPIRFATSPASLLRLRSRAAVLQRELHRDAVTLLHVLERRGRKVEQHPALGRLMKSRPLSGATLVTSPVIVWRPIMVASAVPCAAGCGGGVEGLCATARPASSKPAVMPASIAGSCMAFFSFCLVDHPTREQRTCQRATVARNDRKRDTSGPHANSIVLFCRCVTSRPRVLTV